MQGDAFVAVGLVALTVVPVSALVLFVALSRYVRGGDPASSAS
jgi:hypothetical protein